MKLSQVLQSLFLGLILLGLFAVMAQNSYGFPLMGVSCFGLALLYFLQAGWKAIEDYSSLDKKDITAVSELLLLAFLSLLFGFRAFYINLPFSDIIFTAICSLLIIVYLIIASYILNATKSENPELAGTLIFFYSSILIFLLSLGLRIINPSLSAAAGALGIMASLPFIISLLRNRKYEYSGKSVTLLQFILASRNKAGMLFLFFIFSAVYVGLSNFKVIPSIENADKPKTYIELINQAETGKEKPVNGKFKHEIYKEAMDKFVERHGNRKLE
jgi:hypothetical protein